MITDEDLRKHRIQWAENHALVQKITSQRAQFAAMAMQAMLSRDEHIDGALKAIPHDAVLYADALIKELGA